MASFEFLAIILTGLGLTVSILYYASVLGNQNKTQQMQLTARRTQTFLQLYGSASQETIRKTQEVLEWEWESFEDFDEKYWSNLDDRSLVIFVWERFNGIGLLALEGQVDVRLVKKFSGGIIRSLWRKCEAVILHRREVFGNEGWLEGFEYIFNEIIRLE